MTRQQQLALDALGWCALTNRETLYHTYTMAEDVLNRNIGGCMVECGVFAGAQVAAMWYATHEARKPRMLHLFDSFDGIPLGGEHDGEDIAFLIGRDTRAKEERMSPLSSGKSRCHLDDCRKFMKKAGVPDDVCVYHPGWFQDTLQLISIERIALLRLDGDLYDSTAVCIKALYPAVAEGGIVIIDDWPLVGCRKAVVEYLNDNHLAPKIIEERFGPAWWIKEANETVHTHSVDHGSGVIVGTLVEADPSSAG